MNIFATSACPQECSVMLDDLRLNKMAIETAQIISTVARAGKCDQALMLMNAGQPVLYASTHAKHPCTLWAADNFEWTLFLLEALLQEYEFRRGKRHGSAVVADTFSLPFYPPDPFMFCNCSMFKNDLDVHSAYQATMNIKWRDDIRTPQWTKREKPSWANFNR